MTEVKERHLYEYAVVRFVPSVEREEFINIGLVMMCKRKRWLKVKIHLPEQRIDAFASGVDPMTLEAQVRSFAVVAEGSPRGGYIAQLEAHERFRWLTAVRSACIQTSRPHPGITDDLEGTFARLMRELVL